MSTENLATNLTRAAILRQRLDTVTAVPYVKWELSYARFTPGDFTQAQAQPNGPFTTEPSNFFYFEMSLNAFGDGKPKYQ
jgi:hypothetical protein